MRYRKNQLLEVTWIDAETTSAWSEEDEAKKPPSATFKTVGYYTAQDKDYLYLSWTIGVEKDNKTRSKDVIPRGCIKDIKKL